ncbi:rCG58098, partial [Rattus norvegicus]
TWGSTHFQCSAAELAFLTICFNLIQVFTNLPRLALNSKPLNFQPLEGLGLWKC